MSAKENAAIGERIVIVDEFRLAIDAMDSLGLGQGQAFEPDILAALQRWVQPGNTVVDIGTSRRTWRAWWATRARCMRSNPSRPISRY